MRLKLRPSPQNYNGKEWQCMQAPVRCIFPHDSTGASCSLLFPSLWSSSTFQSIECWLLLGTFVQSMQARSKHTHRSMLKLQTTLKPRSHSHTYRSMPKLQTKIKPESHSHTYRSMSKLQTKIKPRSHSHTYRSMPKLQTKIKPRSHFYTDTYLRLP